MSGPQVIHNERAIAFFFGELILKGANRTMFERKFAKGVAAVTRHMGLSSVFKSSGRVVAIFEKAPERQALLDAGRRVFGAASYAPCYIAEASLEDVGRVVVSGLHGRDFKTFGIKARRSDKSASLGWRDVAVYVGDLVRKTYPGVTVDLDEPEQSIWIDILRDRVFVYFDKFRGAGGLPVGTGGKVACLISGGIDSPVASWMMAKRGCIPYFIHFHSAPFTDTASQEKVEDIVRVLNGWCGWTKLIMVPFGELQKKLVVNIPAQYRVIMYRRFMMRIAEVLARREGCHALITGESLGQVASQTLENIACVSEATSMPILRPLIGMDKMDITDLARQIGTFELSIEPHMDCCSFLEPRFPETRARAQEIADIEAKFDVAQLVDDVLKKIV